MPREMLVPGPEHPITIAPTSHKVRVKAGGETIAETTSALTLSEADYPPVQYVPLADVNSAALRSTQTESYCPYKGQASYYSIVTAGGEMKDTVWTYERPRPAVSEIAGHLAFYPDRVEISIEDD